MAERAHRTARAAGVALLVLLLIAGAAAAVVALREPRLTAAGPTSVTGTDATAVFTVGDRTIRQIRYDDRGMLHYRFELSNPGQLPLDVTGLASDGRQPRLFRLLSLADDHGNAHFTVPRHGSTAVELVMRMSGCETLSARAGSFVQSIVLETERFGLGDELEVTLPEELHTGSPREAFCPEATASSRSPG